MTDFTHLDAIDLRLSHERVRLANARTPGESAMRAVWVAQIEKERANEISFLESKGVKFPSIAEILSDDELLAELAK